MHRGWQSLSTLRSDSRNWPSSIGAVGVVGLGEVEDLDLAAADEGLRMGLVRVARGERGDA